MIQSGKDFFGGTPGPVIHPADSPTINLQPSAGSNLGASNSTLPSSNVQGVGRGLLREIPPTAGMLIGGFLGGPPGAGAGAAAGETVSQYAEKALGERTDIDPEKIVEAGVTGALVPPLLKKLGVLGKWALKGTLSFAGKQLEPLINISKAGLTGIKKVLPGISAETSLTIKQYPREVEHLAKMKTLPLNPLLERINKAKDVLREKTQKAFSTGLESIKSSNPFGKTGKILISKEMGSETAGLPSTLRRYRIGVSKDGALNFDKLNSAVINTTERNQLQMAYDTVKNQSDFSVQGVQDVAARLTALSKYFEGDRKVSSAAIGAITDAYESAIKKAYPQLSDLRSFYSSRQKLLGVLDQITPDNKSMNELLSPAGITKLKSMTKEEIGTTYKGFFDALRKETGLDLETELRLYSAAREINPNLIIQDVGGLVRGVQLAANPVIGSVHIEAAKFMQSDLAQSIKSSSPQVWNTLKVLLESGVKSGAYMGAREGMNQSFPESNTLTRNEADSLGLPMSLVGRSEADVVEDLNSPTPPPWFGEMKTDMDWNTFKESVFNQ